MSNLQKVANNMSVSFLDIDRPDLRRTTSNTDLSKYNSAAPTLNNTPVASRNPSPDRSSIDNGKKIRKSPSNDQDMSKIKQKPNWAAQELKETWMGIVIIVCFFTSGLLDSVAFTAWSCFLDMQTGNTIFVALGIGGQPVSAHPHQYYKSLLAIAAFCLGTIFFNLLHRWSTGIHNQPTSRRRITLVISFMLQTILILVSASLVTGGIVSNLPFQPGQFSSGSNVKGMNGNEDIVENYHDFIPIFLLSFQAAGQVCFSRVLNLLDLPTIVVSALYHDYVANILSTWHMWKNSTSFKDFVLVQYRREAKRLLSIIALFVGAIVGGETYKSRIGMVGALWIACGLKSGITFAFALWKKDEAEFEDLEKGNCD